MKAIVAVAFVIVMLGCKSEQDPPRPVGTSAPTTMGGVWYVEGKDSNKNNIVWRVDILQRQESVKTLMLGMFGPEANSKVGLFGKVNANGSFRFEGISSSVRYALEGIANAERMDFKGRRLSWISPAGPNDTLFIPVTGQKL